MPFEKDRHLNERFLQRSKGQNYGRCVSSLSRYDQCSMENTEYPHSGTDSTQRWAGASMEGSTCRPKRDSVGITYRCSVGGCSRALSLIPNLSSPVSAMGSHWCDQERLPRLPLVNCQVGQSYPPRAGLYRSPGSVLGAEDLRGLDVQQSQGFKAM